MSTGTPIPAQWTCRRRCRNGAKDRTPVCLGLSARGVSPRCGRRGCGRVGPAQRDLGSLPTDERAARGSIPAVPPGCLRPRHAAVGLAVPLVRSFFPTPPPQSASVPNEKVGARARIRATARAQRRRSGGTATSDAGMARAGSTRRRLKIEPLFLTRLDAG